MTHWADDLNFDPGAPRAGQPVKVEPDAAALAQGILGGGTVPSGRINWMLNLLDVSTAGAYGNGAAGAIVVAGGTTTLGEDLYATDLTVAADGILETNGYRVFANGILTNDGVIRHNGGDGGDGSEAGGLGVGGAGGAGAAPGSVGGDQLTGSAGVGAGGGNGTNGPDAVVSLGGNGGAAGGDSVAFAGGSGGIATAPAPNDGGYQHPTGMLGVLASRAAGGLLWVAGGAAGASAASAANPAASGGGGGPGGVVVVAARWIQNNGVISAFGGAAGASYTPGPAVGGSGGGGGGAIFLVRRRISGVGSLLVSGGAGAPGLSGGFDGSAGVGGTVVGLLA